MWIVDIDRIIFYGSKVVKVYEKLYFRAVTDDKNEAYQGLLWIIIQLAAVCSNFLMNFNNNVTCE
jgi:hypothetical protein